MKREGFTLVELLIVIVVIGILSTMVMMSSTEAVTSSRASNIVSNLRNVKAAALALYSDSMDKFIADPNAEIKIDDVQSYLQNGKDIPDIANFIMKHFNGSWYVYYNLSNTGAEKDRLAEKISGRAKSAGLLGAGKDDTTAPADDAYFSNHYYVVMKIR